MIKTRREKINEHFKVTGDTWEDVVECTLSDEELESDHNIYSDDEGFTIWTKEYVYFPEVYDGRWWVRSVSRDPNGKPTAPVGGD